MFNVEIETSQENLGSTRFQFKSNSLRFILSSDMCNEASETKWLAMSETCIISNNQRIKIVSEKKTSQGFIGDFLNTEPFESKWTSGLDRPDSVSISGPSKVFANAKQCENTINRKMCRK